MEILWLVVVLGGPLVLGAAIAYALLRRRRLSQTERSMRERATQRGYNQHE